MTILKARLFCGTLGLTFLAGTMMVSAAPTGWNEPVEKPPLTVEQMFQLPNLQLNVSHRPVSTGVAFQTPSTVRGAWRYSIHYRYSQHNGWHVAGWGAEWILPSERHASSDSYLAGAHGGAHSNLIPVDNDFPSQNAPGPDDIPSPDGPPLDPGTPATEPGGQCPFMGSGWDGQWTFEWVPTEVVRDDDGNVIEVIPGHWRLIYYEFRTAPSDLCDWS